MQAFSPNPTQSTKSSDGLEKGHSGDSTSLWRDSKYWRLYQGESNMLTVGVVIDTQVFGYLQRDIMKYGPHLHHIGRLISHSMYRSHGKLLEI